MRDYSHGSLFVAGVLVIAFCLSEGAAIAKVSPQEAEQLRKGPLTPMGAVKAGNDDGSIPAWNGGITEVPQAAIDAGYVPGTKGMHVLDPFPDDEPLFTITSDNLDRYKAHLSPGQIALFDFFEDYKMPVFQTRRTAAKKQFIYDEIYENATKAEMIANGEGLSGARMGVPFPIPKSGREVIWNHKTRYRGLAVRRWNNQFPVTTSGDFNPVKLREDVYFVYSDPDATREGISKGNVLIYFLQVVREPARLAGRILLVHETANQVKETRRAWLYNPGQRRVRRAPNVGYDNPGTGSDGLRTNDQLDLFNGAMDRYTWKLKGKKELFVPYNAYRIHSPELNYDDIIQPRHINQDYTRYERHRVWVVEAEVREGTSHMYAERTFYVDEDSWQIMVADNYDRRGELWRIQEGHQLHGYDNNFYMAQGNAAHTVYDLQNSRYLALALNNEDDETMPIEDVIDDVSSYYNPRSIQRFAFQ